MAIVVNGTVNNLPVSQLPNGYTPPTITRILDFHYRYDVTIPLIWSTVINTTNPITNMTSIVTGVNNAVTTLLGLDFLATATVTAYAVINGLDININTSEPTNLTNSNTPAFQVQVTIFVKSV